MIFHYESIIFVNGFLYIAFDYENKSVPEMCLEDWSSTFELVDMADMFAEEKTMQENNHE